MVSKLLLALLLTCGLGIGADVSVKTDLVPVVRFTIPSLDGVLDRLEQVTRKSGVPVTKTQVLKALEMIMETPDLGGLDRKRPAFVEIYSRRDDLPRWSQDDFNVKTDLAIVLPIVSSNQFRQLLGRMGVVTRRGEEVSVTLPNGLVLTFALSEEIAIGVTNSKLYRLVAPPQAQTPREVIAQLDIFSGTIFSGMPRDESRTILRQSFDDLMDSSTPEDRKIGRIITEPLADLIANMISDFSAVEAHLALADEGLRIRTRFKARPGSPLARQLERAAPRSSRLPQALPSDILAGAALNLVNTDAMRNDIGVPLFNAFEQYMEKRYKRWDKGNPKRAEEARKEFALLKEYCDVMRSILSETRRFISTVGFRSNAERTQFVGLHECEGCPEGLGRLQDLLHRIYENVNRQERTPVNLERPAKQGDHAISRIGPFPAPPDNVFTQGQLSCEIAVHGPRAVLVLGDMAGPGLKDCIADASAAASAVPCADPPANVFAWVNVKKLLDWVALKFDRKNQSFNIGMAIFRGAFMEGEHFLTLSGAVGKEGAVVNLQVPEAFYTLMGQGFNLGIMTLHLREQSGR